MTLDEIKAAIKENADLGKEVAEYSAQTEAGKVILENYLTAKKEDVVKTAIEEHNNNTLSLLKEAGFEIKEGQNIVDSVKELSAKVKELSEKGDSGETEKLKKELKELKESGELNQYFKEESEKLKAKISEMTESHNEQIANKDKEYQESRVKAELQSGLASLNYDKDDKAVNALISTIETNLLNNVKEVEGKFVFSKDPDTEYRDASFNIMSTADIWKTELDGYLQKEKVGTGAERRINSTGGVVKDDKGLNKLILNPSSFTTRTEFEEVAEKALIAQGIIPNSAEAETLIDSAYTEYNVNKLN